MDLQIVAELVVAFSIFITSMTYCCNAFYCKNNVEEPIVSQPPFKKRVANPKNFLLILFLKKYIYIIKYYFL